MIHKGTLHSREPALLSCSCGREFSGDWDDVVNDWNSHFDSYDEIVTSSPTMLTRAGEEQLKEIMQGPRIPLPAAPLEIQGEEREERKCRHGED